MNKNIIRNKGKGYHIKANYFSKAGQTDAPADESWWSQFGRTVTSPPNQGIPQQGGGSSSGAAAGGTGGASGGKSSFMSNMKNTFSGSNVGGMVAGAAGSIGSAVGNLAGGAIADGLESKAGSGISKVGGAIGSAVGTVNPILGAAISAASGIIGGGVSRIWGSKMNQEFINGVETNNKQLNNVNVGVGSYDNIMNQMKSTNFGNDFGQNKVGRDGLLSHKAKDKYNSLIHDQGIAQNRSYTTFGNAVDATEQIADDNAQNAFVAAYGGQLNMKHYNNNFFADGGKMTAFQNQATEINNGGTHEQNPYGGVQMGTDRNGTPNLVEQGEVKYDNYVFSNRLYATGGELVKSNLPKKYAKHTFAYIAGDINKAIKEEPNDPVTEAGVKANMTRLRDLQNAKKQAKMASLQKQMSELQGGMPQQGGQQQMMAMQQQQQGQQEQPSEEEQMQQMQQQRQEQQPQEEEGQEQQQPQEGGEQTYAYGGQLGTRYGNVNILANGSNDNNYYGEEDSNWREGTQEYIPEKKPVQKVVAKKPVQKVVAKKPFSDAEMEAMYNEYEKDPSGINSIPYNAVNKKLNYFIDTYYPSKAGSSFWRKPTDSIADEEFDKKMNANSPFDIDQARTPWSPQMEDYLMDYYPRKMGYFPSSRLPETSPQASPGDYQEQLVPLQDPVPASPNYDKKAPYAASLRYMPTIMSGMQAFSDWNGKSNVPDYGNANMPLSAKFRDMSSPHIGGYLQYNPVDRNRDINVMRAENAAARNAYINLSAGNRSTAMANIAAGDLAHQGKIGDLLLTADKFDNDQRMNYAKYNLGINQYNAESDLKAQQGNLEADKARAQMLVESAKMRQQVWDDATARKRARLDRFMENIGQTGKDIYDTFRIDNNKNLLYTSQGNHKKLTKDQARGYNEWINSPEAQQAYLDK